MVGIISINEDIVFTDEELPPEGTDHTRALYITIRQGPDSVPLVLIDNGSDLNVCPLRVALRLGLDPRDFIKGMQGVRAFDNIRRDVIGEVDLVITVGCVPFTMTFQVLDIQSSSNLLLRRPWLHAVQAVPSSLHQRLKLKHDGRILVIPSEEEIVDESEAIFTPCTYKIRNVEILEGSSIKDPITEIVSFRGRFCEQALRDEIIIAQGKIERVQKRDGHTNLRLLLGNRISDYMIMQ